MRKTSLLFIFLLGFIISSGQNNVLRGVVKLQSSGSKPLADVKMSAFGAGTVYSNSNGMFEMAFKGKVPGSAVSLFVQKDGYELINDKELENCVLRDDPDDLVLVVMAKQGERNKQALDYYNIIIENTNNNYKRQLNNIHSRLDALDEDDKTRQVLRKQIDALQKEKETLLTRAEELAKQLASVDMDRASSLAREAYKKFKDGDIQSALVVLNDETLDQNYHEAKEENLKLKKRLIRSDSALAQSIENYMIKARFCISDRQFQKAYDNYNKAFRADSTNVNNLIEIGDYCDRLSQQTQALRFYETAIRYCNSDALRAKLLLKQGLQYSYDNKYEDAEVKYQQALHIAQSIFPENKDKHGQLLADVYKASGRMFIDLNKHDFGEENYLQSLHLLEELAENNPDKYEASLANIHLAIGDLYSMLGRYDEAYGSMEFSLQIYDRKEAFNPGQFQTQIATTHLGMAILMARIKNFNKAELSFIKAINTFQNLSEENPFQYESQLASAQMSLSVMYYHWGKYNESEKGYLTTIQIYNKLVKENPSRYEPALAKTFLNLGSLYSSLSNYEKSEEVYLKSLKLRRKLTLDNPQRFTPLLCHALLNLAYMKKRQLYESYDMSQIDKALAYIAETENILSQYDKSLPWVSKYIGDADGIKSYFVGVTEESISVQNEIDKLSPMENTIPSLSGLDEIILTYLEIIDSLHSSLNKYPDNKNLTLKLAETYGTIAAYQLYNQQFAHAEKSATLGLRFDKEETWINSYLALALSYQGNFKKAIKIYKEYLDKDYQGDSLNAIFLEDLKSLEDQGIFHTNNEKLYKVLNR